ncbi:hypothetical protein CYMTET_6729 [Cymbomonas tetramitiformis]|uniref:Uncharacterized protein n=1 Tax=Cymbomonas tetramitiformis TaxID=36881 RepID=A0AAE0LI49_9CHLO|nr:hypothetical protein CYMTET_6729 [Cymbomonas tetramitiformis]
MHSARGCGTVTCSDTCDRSGRWPLPLTVGAILQGSPSEVELHSGAGQSTGLTEGSGSGVPSGSRGRSPADENHVTPYRGFSPADDSYTGPQRGWSPADDTTHRTPADEPHAASFPGRSPADDPSIDTKMEGETAAHDIILTKVTSAAANRISGDLLANLVRRARGMMELSLSNLVDRYSPWPTNSMQMEYEDTPTVTKVADL